MTVSCETIRQLIAGRLGNVGSNLAAEILSHVEECDECADRLDLVEDPSTVEAIFGSLAGDAEMVATSVLVDEERAEDEAEGLVARDAVEVLLERLTLDVRRPVERVVQAHGPLVITVAVDAVSLFVRRYRRGEQTLPATYFLSDGTVLVEGKAPLGPDRLAEQIARLAELWADPDVSDDRLTPHPDAFGLVPWMYAVALQVPLLFPHFAAVRTRDRLRLEELRPEQRIDDPVARWSKYVRPVGSAGELVSSLESALNSAIELGRVASPTIAPQPEERRSAEPPRRGLAGRHGRNGL